MSYQAYQKTQAAAENPSQTEYRLFAEVTRSLMEVRELAPPDTKLAAALDWNRRLWSVLASDCGAEGNQLPQQLRAAIISLSIWVSKHSSQVMRGNEKVDDLININRTIMEGLAAQAAHMPKAAEPPSQPTPTSHSV